MASLSEAKGRLSNVIDDAKAHGFMESELAQAEAWRRRVHNAIEDLKGTLRVFCRVRPANSRELCEGEGLAVRSVDGMTLEVVRPANSRELCEGEGLAVR